MYNYKHEKRQDAITLLELFPYVNETAFGLAFFDRATSKYFAILYIYSLRETGENYFLYSL